MNRVHCEHICDGDCNNCNIACQYNIKKRKINIIELRRN